jgi:hypothetical protein
MSALILRQLAHARSGDKGGSANIGVIAFTAEGYELLRQKLTAECVESFFMPLGVGRVIRYELPNLLAFNFILPGVLSSGGGTNLRIDAQGKALGQALLALELDVPDNPLAKPVGPEGQTALT